MKILQVTGYPTLNPLHGGQIRASAIAEALRQDGHDVDTFAVYIGDHFKDARDGDLAVPFDSKHFPADLAFISDYLTGVYLAASGTLSAAAAARIRGSSADAMIVEHPWLFDFVKSTSPAGTRIIYSSHNIEWRLKRDGSAGAPLADVHVQAIRQMEARAAEQADLVIACTAADAGEISTLTDGRCAVETVVVCGNAVDPFTCTRTEVAMWRNYFDDTIGAPFPIFVSSGHLPNAEGFWRMMAPGLTFLRPGEAIVVVGGVCSLITAAQGMREYAELNHSRLHLVGTRPKNELQAMIRASHVVLLPITSGEGSNLKTAEALESGCPIVATSKAMRGFEAAIGQAHIVIADTPAEFRAATRAALAAPRRETLTPIEIRSLYYWATQLKPLTAAVGQMHRHRRSISSGT